MAGRSRNGFGKRAGYLDQDVVTEDRVIRQENMRTHVLADKNERPSRRWRRVLLESAGRTRRDDVRSAAEVLAERLAEGEGPDTASAAALAALRFVYPELPRNVEQDWDWARRNVLSTWARTMGKGTTEAETILSALPQRPQVDPVVRDTLIAAGRASGHWEALEGPGRRLCELLASGSRFGPATARAWRGQVRENASEEERRSLGRRWAEVSRLVQTQWVHTHPEDGPVSQVQQKKQVQQRRTTSSIRKVPASRTRRTERKTVRSGEAQERLELLEAAAADAPGWFVLQPEGQHLIEDVADGVPHPEAAMAAETELAKRRTGLSAEDWALVQLEWGKVLAAVERATGTFTVHKVRTSH